jgi:drug/metabolite transporter, DME family
LSATSKNRFLLFAAAVLFSTGGAAIKACTLTSWQIAGFRSGVAALGLLAFLPNARPSRTAPRAGLFNLWNRHIWLTGCAYAATVILFVLANKLTTAANSIYLQSTAPLYLLLLGPLVLREPIRKVDIAVIAAVAAGAVLLLRGFDLSMPTAPDPARGNILGLAAGAAWALTITGLRWIERRETGKDPGESESGVAAVIAGNVIAFATCLPLALPGGGGGNANIAIILYLGVFQVALAYICLTRSLREVPALEAATLLLIEPVFNPLWTWLVHGERPSRLALIGGAMIIGAAFGGTAWRVRSTGVK